MEEFLTKQGDIFLWTQPKATSRIFELHRKDEPFGTLEFRSMWGTLAFPKIRSRSGPSSALVF